MTDESPIKNLGRVPVGMTFIDAAKALPLKVTIDPFYNSRHLTICETMREVWRVADRIGGRDGADLKALAAAGYHFAKAMDSRLREVRAREYR